MGYSFEKGREAQVTLRKWGHGFSERVQRIGRMTGEGSAAEIPGMVFAQFQDLKLSLLGHISRVCNGQGMPVDKKSLDEAIDRAGKRVFAELHRQVNGSGLFDDEHNSRYAKMLIRHALKPNSGLARQNSGRTRQAKKHHR